eukprot:1133178-Alexandrium_andersonii.AAC.1
MRAVDRLPLCSARGCRSLWRLCAKEWREGAAERAQWPAAHAQSPALPRFSALLAGGHLQLQPVQA